MPEIPDVIQGEPVASSWGNTIRSRTTMRYADLGDLVASEPVPELGALRWLDDPAELVVWEGTEWVPAGRVRQAFRWQGQAAVAADNLGPILIEYDITGLGIDPSRCVVSIIASGNNQQSRRCNYSHATFTTDQLDVWVQPTPNITSAGTAFFQVSVVEYLDTITIPTPPIIS